MDQMTRDILHGKHDSDIHGTGIFTTRDIAFQECVLEVEGQKMTSEEIESDGIFSKRSGNAYRFNKDHYISPEGEAADFLNHSCSPNAYISKMNDALYVNAADFIPAGSEVLIDYSTIMASDDLWQMDCACGSVNCRGSVRKFMDLPQNTQEGYKQKGWVPSYILEI
jgi:SET domain-containing protein